MAPALMWGAGLHINFGRGRVTSADHAHRLRLQWARTQRICSNTQIRAAWPETETWTYVCKIVKNPEILDQENKGSERRNMPIGDIDGLRAQLHKLRHGMERLIDSLAEGAIEKDQFTARIDRTKTRIAEIETKIGAQARDEGEGPP